MSKLKVPDSSSNFKLILIIIFVLIAVSFTVVFLYALDRDKLVKEKDNQVHKLQKRLRQLNAYVEKIQTNVFQEQNEKKESKLIQYSNKNYGFSFSLPESWSQYLTKNRILNFGGDGSAQSIDFYFEKDKLAFNIGFIPLEKWDAIKDVSYYKVVKLAENNVYIFALSVPKKADPSFRDFLTKDFVKVINNFQTLDIEVKKDATENDDLINQSLDLKESKIIGDSDLDSTEEQNLE